MEGGLQHNQRREYRQRFRFRDMRYGETYHPAYAWGRWIVFFCIVFMFIAAFTGFVPPSLQQIVIVLWITIFIFGSVLACVGISKSYYRGVIRSIVLVLVAIVIAIIMVVSWYFTR
jgi:lipopolysaccharide export LptBFGC system permease protein LptF